YRLAWPSQARKKLSETKRRVALHAGFSQLPASLIHCAKHTVLLVNVYSIVIHENSSFLFLSTLCTEGLLSFFLSLYLFGVRSLGGVVISATGTDVRGSGLGSCSSVSALTLLLFIPPT